MRRSVALGLFLAVASCKSTCASSPDASQGVVSGSLTAAPPKAPIHLLGRFYGADASGRSFTYSSTQIRARFSGTGLTAKLMDESGQNQFSVIVDGKAPVVLKTVPKKSEYVVASGLAQGEHDIAIIRRTETWLGPSRFAGLVPDPGGALLETPPPYSRVIEVVGDSISCGFGVHGSSAACPFSPETEDSTATYGAFTAAAVGAAHMDVCWSGRGLYRNNDGSTTDTMPELYERNWDAPRYEPDVIVVNLGTNDYFAGGDPGAPFEPTYVSFVKRLRAAHPKAWVICGIGSMLTGADAAGARAHVQNVVRTLSQGGDAKVAFVDWAEQSPADGVGCGNHPNETTQRKMADVLTAKVKELTGW